MTEYTKEMVKAAAKKAGLWRKIYNVTCRKCKPLMFNACKNVKTEGSGKAFDNMGDVLSNGLCPICKKRVDNLLK